MALYKRIKNEGKCKGRMGRRKWCKWRSGSHCMMDRVCVCVKVCDAFDDRCSWRTREQIRCFVELTRSYPLVFGSQKFGFCQLCEVKNGYKSRYVLKTKLSTLIFPLKYLRAIPNWQTTSNPSIVSTSPIPIPLKHRTWFASLYLINN